MKLRVLDAFAGIGGFSVGLESTEKFKTVAVAEIIPYCLKVLNRHWPTAQQLGDIKRIDGKNLRGKIDVISAGFPCQDISTLGRGRGISGSRSSLWEHVVRIAKESNARGIIFENVASLRSKGLEKILSKLSAVGYDAEWHCVPASAVGAPHERDRVWIVAHARRNYVQDRPAIRKSSAKPHKKKKNHQLEYAGLLPVTVAEGLLKKARRTAWPIEPSVGRVANGIPDRAHRIFGLGNSVVPKVAALMGEILYTRLDRGAR